MTKYNEIQTPLGSIETKITESQIYISNRDYYIIENDSKKRMYYISDFYFNPVDKDMSFKLKSHGYKDGGDALYFRKDIICSLKLENGYWEYLSGNQDDSKVEFRKI